MAPPAAILIRVSGKDAGSPGASTVELYEPRLGEEEEEFGIIEDKAFIRYKCGRCGAEFDAMQLEYMPSIKCPYCGYRVLYKIRPPGRKLIKAI